MTAPQLTMNLTTPNRFLTRVPARVLGWRPREPTGERHFIGRISALAGVITRPIQHPAKLLRGLFMWSRRKSSERPPWYRASSYRGKLTEAEKRELDAFRARPSHPAFEYGELPEHVEMYISGLEIEAYDLKQARAFGRAIIWSLIGAAVLYATHFGFSRRDLIWNYVFGIAFLIVPWIAYRFESKKIVLRYTSEGIQEEWELDHITKAHLAAKGRDPPSL